MRTNKKRAASAVIANVFIPFCGFYETNLAADIDDDISREIEWFTEGKGVDLTSEDFDVDYRRLYKDVAQGLADYFPEWIKEHTGITISSEFTELHRPREYNFATDKIFCDIPYRSIKKLLNWLNKQDDRFFEAYVFDCFMPRSGFVPFYSNRLSEWGAFNTWTCVQLSVVLAAVNQYITGEYPEHYDTLEGRFYDHWRGNNSISDYMTRITREAKAC